MNPLVGSWRLVAWQVVIDGEARELFGNQPNGYLILTQGGRAMVVTTAEVRTPDDSDAGRAALHRSMVAYTGLYRVEGDQLVTTVQASWNEAWNGTEQRRRFRIEGNRLFIESEPAPSLLYPGTVDFRRIIWERE